MRKKIVECENYGGDEKCNSICSNNTLKCCFYCKDIYKCPGLCVPKHLDGLEIVLFKMSKLKVVLKKHSGIYSKE